MTIAVNPKKIDKSTNTMQIKPSHTFFPLNIFVEVSINMA